MVDDLEDDAIDGEFDGRERRLCGDGACTGLVGEDGRCRLCGRSLPMADLDDASLTKGAAAADPEDSVAGSADLALETLTIEGDPDERVLCVDGNCVGLVGEDGRCKLCGIPASGQPVSAGDDQPGSDRPGGS